MYGAHEHGMDCADSCPKSLYDRSVPHYQSGIGVSEREPIGRVRMHGRETGADGARTGLARGLDGAWTEGGRKWADPSNDIATVLRIEEIETLKWLSQPLILTTV